MIREKKQLQLKKFKVAKLGIHFLKGGSEAANNTVPSEVSQGCTGQAVNSNAATTCTVLPPRTNIDNKCGGSFGIELCNVVSG